MRYFQCMFQLGIVTVFLTCSGVSNAQENTHYLKAKERANAGNYEAALQQLDSAILADSMVAYFFINKSDVEFELKRYQDAVKTLSTAIALMPDSAILYDARGNLLDAYQLHEDAIFDYTTTYEMAISMELKSHSLSNRGGAKFKIRDFSGAYNDLLLAYQLDTTNIDALNNLASVCDHVGREEETIGYLEGIVALDSLYVPAWINLGYKYQTMDEHQKAISYFDRAISIDSTEALAYSNRSYSNLKINDKQAAMLDISRSLDLFKLNAYAYKIRALIHLADGNTSLACDDLALALEYGYRNRFGDEVDELMNEHCKKE